MLSGLLKKLLLTTSSQKSEGLETIFFGTEQAFSLRTKTDTFLNIRISRNTSIAILISLLIHALVLFFVLPQLLKPNGGFPPPKALTITLNQNKSQSSPKDNASKQKTKHVKSNANDTTPPPVIASKSEPNNIPTQALPRPPESSKQNQAEQATDMMSLINANRQRRQAEEQSASAKDRGAPIEDQRDAAIKRNLAQEGTNGIFQIRYIGLHTGQFSFKGWKNNYNNARLETFDVQAKGSESIQLAIIRKMIAIIRQEYSGDFQWESQQLGRAVTLSARLEDSAELEQFLLKEMFPNYGFR